MTRHLKLLQAQPQLSVSRRHQPETALFWWGVTALVASFIFSGNVVGAMVGGSIPRFLPASYLAVLGGLIALARMPLHQRSRDAPGLLLFVFAVPGLALYSAYWQGISGTAVYVESYWIAGLLALMLEAATARQKRLLGGILIAICLINVVVGLSESLRQSNWFPLLIDPDKDVLLDRDTTEFRAHGFYGHPLNASLITGMAIYLLYSMRLRFIVAAPIFGALLLGLLAFGGRTALGVTLIASGLYALYMVFQGVIRRDLKLDLMLTVISAVVVVPIVILIVASQTSIADRIIENLYYDDSAATRVTQWEILNYLDLRSWLFGVPHIALDLLKYQIGLGGKDTDIENFWLLMFLNLGLLGFATFLAVLGIFLVHLGRHANSIYGWLIIITTLLIDSTSNSLGVRTNDLFIMVGFVIAVAGYQDIGRVPVPRTRVRDRAGLRPGSGLSAVPVGSHTLRT